LASEAKGRGFDPRQPHQNRFSIWPTNLAACVTHLAVISLDAPWHVLGPTLEFAIEA
jgi:hypothetical protein